MLCTAVAVKGISSTCDELTCLKDPHSEGNAGIPSCTFVTPPAHEKSLSLLNMSGRFKLLFIIRRTRERECFYCMFESRQRRDKATEQAVSTGQDVF